jgi:hypothetical protein
MDFPPNSQTTRRVQSPHRAGYVLDIDTNATVLRILNHYLTKERTLFFPKTRVLNGQLN